MPVWPVDLPQQPERDTQQHVLPNQVIRTQMDAGLPKVRRRFTSGLREVSVTYVLTKPQLFSFDTFFNTTLAGGSLSFDWPDPYTDGTTTARFKEPPTGRPIGGRTWRIECHLEILP